MTTSPDAPSQKKPTPVVALALATSLGAGYMPIAPGTWGSAAGVILAAAITLVTPAGTALIYVQLAAALVIAIVGVWSASQAAEFAQTKDPQFVVIDEVSGVMITLLFGLGLYAWVNHPGLASANGTSVAAYLADGLVNWKYLLAGFILFRVFDIWKPFPARQAESLSSGLGIMADDWIAGIYAAMGLWIARAAGL